MPVNENLRGTHSIAAHIRIMELHPLIILQGATNFFTQNPLAHSMDHDELSLAIADRGLQRSFEVRQLIAQSLLRTQVRFILHQLMQVQVHLGNATVLGLLRCLAGTNAVLFSLAFLHDVVGRDHTGLVITYAHVRLSILVERTHQPPDGTLQLEAIGRTHPHMSEPAVPQHNSTANLIQEGHTIAHMQFCARHTANLRAHTPAMIRSSLLLLVLGAFASVFGQNAEPCSPVGGKPSLERLFEQELVYPAVALEAGIKGEVVIATEMDQNGNVTALKIGRTLSPECDKEALRLLKMVLWKPGLVGADCSGNDHYISVPFEPGKYKRWLKARHALEGEVFKLPTDSSNAVWSSKQVDTHVTPVIPNGMAGLPKYLSQELRYPPEAFRISLDGTVQVEFVVEPSGSLSNMHVLQEVGGGCNEEAMRLMYRIPWHPAVRNGQRVRSSMQVSIRFDLPKERH